MTRTVAVVGATGLIGGALARALVARGDRVRAVSRRGNAHIVGAQDVTWDPAAGDPPVEVTAGVDAVVNLAGAPIAGGRWTTERRQLIRDSRIVTTRMLAERVGGDDGPAVLVNGSAVGYYGTRRGDDALAEDAGPGDDFLARTCVGWEAATAPAVSRGARVVIVRSALVLAGEGGILPPLAKLSRLMVGGPVGGGRQWMSWVHIDDEVAVLQAAIDDVTLSGAVNSVAPAPVRQAEFMRVLGRVLSRPSVVPTPAVAVRLAMGEMATLALDGQRVAPGVLSDREFRFTFTRLEPALREALDRPA